MERCTVDLRFGLFGGAFANLGFVNPDFIGGDDFVSVIQDWRVMEPIVVDYGIQGTDPTDRIADAGTCRFPLNNTSGNVAKTLGWYSPLNAIKRGGFDFNIPVQ